MRNTYRMLWHLMLKMIGLCSLHLSLIQAILKKALIIRAGIQGQAGIIFPQTDLHHHFAVHFQVQFLHHQPHPVQVPAAAVLPAEAVAVAEVAAGKIYQFKGTIILSLSIISIPIPPKDLNYKGGAMPLYKTSKADLRGKYKRNLEVSIITALIFLIAAFKYSPQKKEVKKYVEPNQDLIPVTEIIPTNQRENPPKIKPLVPQISMDPEIKDIEFESTDLFVDAKVDKPPERIEVHKTIDNENVIFEAVEEPPKPVGGIAAIQNKIQYTELAKKIGIEGKVIVQAIINKNGDVGNASILKSLFPQLDEIALNAVKETKFFPGKQRGKPVNVKMTIPITFKLQ